MSNIELKGLQGLNLLLANEFQNADAGVDEAYLKAPVSSLSPCSYQPRRKFNEDEIHELAKSIKAQGIIQPIIVRKLNPNKYEIVAGERRWRAAQIAELHEVPIICRDINDATALAFALVENVQRKDLNVVDEAYAIKTMIERFSMTQEEISEMLGKGRSTIANLLRILHLNPKVVEMLINEAIELGHAKLLLSLNHEDQLAIADIIVEKSLSVRATEKFIESMKNSINQLVNRNGIFDERLKLWQEHLSRKLHSKVHIKLNANGKGRVIINLESLDEIEWLIDKLERI